MKRKVKVKSRQMEIKVLFFGMLHEMTGCHQEVIMVQEGSRLADLWAIYVERFPHLGELSRSISTSINQELTDHSQSLEEGDEVAFLPPVSGGKEDIFQITHKAINTVELVSSLKSPASGALVVFEGVVRNHSAGRRTLYLQYEAYEPMALKQMCHIGAKIHDKFSIDRVGIVHRVGRLEIGETSVAIAVSSGHRKVAFEACCYGTDRLKQVVPIWKKEFFEDGAVWVEGEGKTQIFLDTKASDH